MAIRYEAPQPFAPGISSEYGAAEVMNRNNPVILDAATETSRQKIAAGERAKDRRAASSSQAMALAQRQTEADYGNIQQANIANAQVRQRQSEQEDQRQQGVNELEVRRSAQQAEIQSRRDEIAARGQVQGMLMEQELTFREQQRMKQLESRLADVANNPSLSEQEKRDLMMEIKTDINPMQRRQQAGLAKQQVKHAQLYEQQVKHRAMVDAKVAALHSKSEQDRTSYVLDPAIEAEVTRELAGQPISKEELQMYGERAPRMRVVAAAAKRGGLMGVRLATGFNANGEAQYQDVKPEKAAPAKPEKSMAPEWAKVADSEAMTAFPDDKVDADTGKVTVSAEQLARRNAHRQGVFNREKGMAGGGQPPTVGGSQAAAPTEQHVPPPRTEAKPFLGKSLDEMDGYQKQQNERTTAKINELRGRTDLPPETREHAVMVVQAMFDLLAANGSVDQMSGPTKALYEKYEKEYLSLPKKPQTQAGAPASSPAPTAPAGQRTWLQRKRPDLFPTG